MKKTDPSTMRSTHERVELMISESHDEGEKAAEELLEKFHENGATKVRLVRNKRA